MRRNFISFGVLGPFFSLAFHLCPVAAETRVVEQTLPEAKRIVLDGQGQGAAPLNKPSRRYFSPRTNDAPGINNAGSNQAMSRRHLPPEIANGIPRPENAIVKQSRQTRLAPDRVAWEMYEALDRSYRVRRGEVLAINMTPASREIAEKKGFTIVRNTDLSDVGIKLDVLQAPKGMSVDKALKKLRKHDPDGAYEPNSIFESSGAGPSGFSLEFNGRPGDVRLGIIDTAIYQDLQPFSNSVINQKNFGRGASITPRDHGTYVAALSVQYGVGDLLIADAFSGAGVYTDAEALARSLNWMARENVAVINMSLAGPPHVLLEAAIARLIDRGHVIVAAVGNEGPDSPPQYPAAYPSVIGVTAIDSQYNIYERANRGPEVDVASLGVNVTGDDETLREVSGTSFATPAVAAFIAERIEEPEPGAPGRWGDLVEMAAIDLGMPGKDHTYGAGYLFVKPESKFD